jgi:hypothetical protein
MLVCLRCGTMWMSNLLVATNPFFASRGTIVGSSTSYYSTLEERRVTLLYMYANVHGLGKCFE